MHSAAGYCSQVIDTIIVAGEHTVCCVNSDDNGYHGDTKHTDTHIHTIDNESWVR